jgi:hypothetical protein
LSLQTVRAFVEWKSRAARSTLAHRLASKGFEKLHLRLGIPLVVLSAAVGLTVFATLEGEANFWLRVATGACSGVATVLAALQTFLDPQARGQAHARAAAGYAAVRREIEQAESLDLPPGDALTKLLTSIRERLDELAATGPSVADRYWEGADKLQKQLDEQQK